jgi:hypothetical protein
VLCEDFAAMLDRGLDRGAPDAGGAA